MSLQMTFATATRVLSQIRHDHRTLALMFAVPPILITILKYVFQGEPKIFDNIAPILLGIFPVIIMFLISSIATMRERSSGTLKRLMTMPMAKTDFIFGYAIAFCFLGFIQALISCGVTLGLLGVTTLGGALPTLIIAVLSTFLGTAMGLFTSAFAKSEFQAVQFMPAFIFPQLLICGLFIARTEMSSLLQKLSDIMPLTYVVEAMKQVSTNANWGSDLTKNIVIIFLFAIGFLILGSATIRRQE